MQTDEVRATFRAATQLAKRSIAGNASVAPAPGEEELTISSLNNAMNRSGSLALRHAIASCNVAVTRQPFRIRGGSRRHCPLPRLSPGLRIAGCIRRHRLWSRCELLQETHWPRIDLTFTWIGKIVPAGGVAAGVASCAATDNGIDNISRTSAGISSINLDMVSFLSCRSGGN